MKLTLIFTILLTANFLFAQYDISTNNSQTITTCSGSFYDSGLQNGNYSANENYSVSFKSNSNNSIHLMFSSFNVEYGDTLSIYDGLDSSAVLIGKFHKNNSPLGINIFSSSTNSDNALYLKWKSDSVSSGWEAEISCGFPCQAFNIDIDSINALNSQSGNQGFINFCPGDSVFIKATGIYSNNLSSYVQSDLSTKFIYEYVNGIADTSQIFHKSSNGLNSNQIKLYAIDTNGCFSSDFIKINFEERPYVYKINDAINKNPVCLNDSALLNGKFIEVQDSLYTFRNNDTFYIPDGNGVSYTSVLNVNSFYQNQHINSAADIEKVFANIEHSYLGDLEIELECPNGQSVVLKSYPGGSVTHLGEPIDGNAAPIAGIGYEYHWKENASLTMLETQTQLNYVHSYTDLLGNPYNQKKYLPPSEFYPQNSTSSITNIFVKYAPTQSFSNFIGCPVNGNWTLTVTDDLSIDNGYIFYWGISLGDTSNFFSNLSINQRYWINNNDTLSNDTTSVYILADSVGFFDYTYSITDNYNCQFDTTVNIQIIDLPNIDLGSDTALNFLLSPNPSMVLNVGIWDSIIWSNGSDQSTITIDTNILSFGYNTFWVSVTDANSCTATDTIVIELTYLNIDDNKEELICNIYPNPTKNTLFIEAENISNKDVYLSIYNSEGKKVISKELETANNYLFEKIDVSNLSNGIYFIKLENDDYYKILKLVKK